MLFYHENQADENILDNEPLLKFDSGKSDRTKQNIFMSDLISSSNDISLTIEDFYPAGVNSITSENLDAEIEEHLLGIFVVSFDTRQGNILEWQIPSSLNLEHIEFKAMASGFHLIQNDLVLVLFIIQVKHNTHL